MRLGVPDANALARCSKCCSMSSNAGIVDVDNESSYACREALSSFCTTMAPSIASHFSTGKPRVSSCLSYSEMLSTKNLNDDDESACILGKESNLPIIE